MISGQRFSEKVGKARKVVIYQYTFKYYVYTSRIVYVRYKKQPVRPPKFLFLSYKFPLSTSNQLMY